jgi:hypothetical protein
MAERHPQPSRRSRRFAPVITLLFPLLFSACTMPTDSFDSNTWKSQRGASAKDNKRITMVPTLEARIRVGMSREEVVQILGEPDARDQQANADKYFLGLSMGPDQQYYEIRYQNSAVATMRLGQF